MTGAQEGPFPKFKKFNSEAMTSKSAKEMVNSLATACTAVNRNQANIVLESFDSLRFK